MPGVFAEIRRSPDIRRYGPTHRQITKRFLVLNEQAIALENTIWDTVAPNYSGDYAPRCRDIRTQENYPIPGSTMLTAIYKTMRTPGVAKVTFLGRATAQKLYMDLDAKVIQGPDWATGDDETTRLLYYKVMEGSWTVPVPQCYIRIETAYESFTPSKILPLVGTTNASAMSKLGVNAETLILMPPNAYTLWEEDSLAYVNYLFAYEPRGVNNILKEQPAYKVNSDLLIEKEERELHTSFEIIRANVQPMIASGDFAKAQRIVFRIRSATNSFFDNVLVMDKDVKLRRNRLALLHAVSRLLDQIADYSQIVVQG